MIALPWCQMKVAFDLEEFGIDIEPEHFLECKAPLPFGWIASETYFSPIAMIGIFEVSVLPTIKDGETVRQWCAALNK